MTDEERSTTYVPLPEWFKNSALPKIGDGPQAVVLVKRGGLRKSALVFTENGTYVVEKRFLKGLKLYRTDYPAQMVVNNGRCPHCNEAILAPMRVTRPRAVRTPTRIRTQQTPNRTRRRTGAYRYRGYTLHKVNRGRRGTGYFFAKQKPKRGTPVAKPRGYRVKTTKSGLPVLAKN